jgi:CheY-like chemotaxis protein
VLITDDNEDAAYGLSLILQAKGCQVHTCKDGQSALDEYAKFNPNVLILDIGLPDISGHDLLISLLALSSRDRLLSIALTGFGHKEAQEKSTQAGFDYHMTKPVRLNDLLHFLSLHADQLLL